MSEAGASVIAICAWVFFCCAVGGFLFLIALCVDTRERPKQPSRDDVTPWGDVPKIPDGFK